MLFNSYVFIFLFLPLVLFGFFSIAKKTNKGALCWLLIASFIFYGWWQPKYLILLILSLVVNYQIGVILTKETQRSPWLVGGIVFNLALLGYYKYANFIVDNVNYLAHSNYHLNSIILPLAISFFTFQQIAFLVDTYRRQAIEIRFLNYGLFITFFPQLIAGPIVHHQSMMPQFNQKKIFRINQQQLAKGMTLFFIGLFKKVMIADALSTFATPVFNAASNHYVLTIWEAWGGALAYTFQLYFDFSGYSDMALGLALLFGIKLPQNFNSPYQAKSIIEFWRRWHITLSNFLRDYVYIPLGGNRNGKLQRYRNLWITMFIGGIWHGAGWTFMIWGLLHGFYLIVNHLWANCCFKFKQQRYYLLLAQGLTFVCIVIAWVFFRAQNIHVALNMLKSMFLGNGIHLPIRFKDSLIANYLGNQHGIVYEGLFSNGLCHWPSGCMVLLFAAWISFYWPNTAQLLKRRQYTENAYQSVLALHWVPNVFWQSVILFLALSAVLQLGKMSEFLYFQF